MGFPLRTDVYFRILHRIRYFEVTMVRSFFVTCPQAISTANRKARNRKREKKPAVRALVKAWCIGKVCSCGCGRPANTAHHPGELYESDLRYLNLNECEPYYHTCHHLHHRGYIRCPSCGGWMRQGNEKCAKCQGWRRYKDLHRSSGHTRHPCNKNLGQQKCRDGRVCGRSPVKAEGCDWFVARAVKA
jgi:hypothetical protein